MKTSARITVMLPALAALALLFARPLGADDRTYVILDKRAAAKGTELLLRSLQAGEEGKKFRLALGAAEQLIDLAAGEILKPAQARLNDILFIAGSGSSRRLMVITPGLRVHGELAAKQPQEAEAINQLSLQLSAPAGNAPSPARPAAETPRVAASPAPPAAASAELDRMRRSFLFVLEFAMGAPFTAAQEHLILEQFSPAWWAQKTDQEKKAFGRYPQIVAWILQARQEELEEMRSSLEETTRQWLRESPAADPVVAMVRARLQERGRVLYPGEPPLTEMAAAAFSELYAYAELLHRDATATPGQLEPDTVSSVRYDLLRAWSKFSPTEREQVATAPGLWLVMRTLILHGDTAQKENTRRRLLSLVSGTTTAPRPRDSSSPRNAEVNRQIMNNMIKHNTLMAIQQQTFNTYMWSRGFNYQPATGKMW